ncbi:SDR family NAD(P)-dependent oxidoreductase, partial [Acinetobacter baumannii]
TGGAAGIGRAVAERFATAGHALALLDLDPDAVAAAAADLRQRGIPALGIAASVTDEAAVEAAVGQVVHHFGGLDVLVNNA